MQNIEELRKSLSENYELMRAKKMDLAMGKELSNSAGKIIGSLKIELEYNQMRKISRQIDFLEPTNKKATSSVVKKADSLKAKSKKK